MSGLILDIAVVVITVLLLIFGAWRGMYKMLFGLISALLAIVLAVALMNPVSTFVVEKTTLDERLVSALDTPMAESLPNGDQVLQLIDTDGDGINDALGYMIDGEQYAFADLLTDTPYAMLSGVIEGAISDQVTEDSSEVTFRAALSAALTAYIVAAIVFVVLLIVFSILVSLIMKLIKKFVTHTFLGHFLDKLLGAVLGLVLAAVIIFGVLAIIKVLGTYEWIIPVNELIESSTLTKLLYDNNFVYTVLVDAVDLKGMLDGIIGGVESAGGDATEGEEVVEEMIKNVFSGAVAV